MKGCKSQSEPYFANEDWRHRNFLFCPNFRYISNCLCRKCNCNFCTEMKRIVLISSFFLQFDHLVDTPSIRNHRRTKINGLLTTNLLLTGELAHSRRTGSRRLKAFGGIELHCGGKWSGHEQFPSLYFISSSDKLTTHNWQSRQQWH